MDNYLDIHIKNTIIDNNVKINVKSDLYKKINDIYNSYNKYIFFEDSVIQTDQGDINIDKIDPNIHTISNKEILFFSKSIVNKDNKKEDDNIILFKKNALGDNIPNTDTYLTFQNKIEYKDIMYNYDLFFIDLFKEHVIKEINKNNIYYSILLSENTNIIINNMNITLINMYNDIDESNNKDKEKIDLKYDDEIKLNNMRKCNQSLSVNNKLLWDHWFDFGKNENKIMNIKINFENADLDNYIKANKELLINSKNTEINKLAWNHWIKSNKKNTMNIKLDKNNVDYERYKLDYSSLTKKLENNNEKIWAHWINIGKYDNKVFYPLLTYENADFDKYKYDYPFLFNRIYNENLKNQELTLEYNQDEDYRSILSSLHS